METDPHQHLSCHIGYVGVQQIDEIGIKVRPE